MRLAACLAVFVLAAASRAADPPGVTRFPWAPVGQLVTATDGQVYAAPSTLAGIFTATASGPVLCISTSGPVQQLTAGPDGSLWFVDGGQIMRAVPCGAPSPVPQPPSFYQFTVASDGALWYTDNQHGRRLWRRDPSGSVAVISGLPPIFSYHRLVPSIDGAIWVADYEAGLFRVTAGGVVQSVTGVTFGAGLSVPNDSGIAPAGGGSVWLMTKESTGGMRKYVQVNTAGTIVDNFDFFGPEAMAVAPDGSVYIGRYPDISRRAARQQPVVVLSLDNTLGCPNNQQFLAMAVAADGTLWATQYFLRGVFFEGTECPAPTPQMSALLRISSAAAVAGVPLMTPLLLALLAAVLGAVAILRLR